MPIHSKRCLCIRAKILINVHFVALLIVLKQAQKTCILHILWVEIWSHLLHFIGFIPPWTDSVWIFNFWLNTTKLKVQILHVNEFHLSWTDVIMFHFQAFWIDTFEAQMSHLYGLLPLLSRVTRVSCLTFWGKGISQTWHF